MSSRVDMPLDNLVKSGRARGRGKGRGRGRGGAQTVVPTLVKGVEVEELDEE